MQDDDSMGREISGKHYNRACFADDIATLADQLDSCQIQLDKIDKSSTKYGLEISDSRTEVMIITNKTEVTIYIKLKEKPLKHVTEF